MTQNPDINSTVAFSHTDTGATRQKKARKSKYLEVLREEALTIAEVAKKTGYPYTTVYREMNDLIQTYQVYATGQTKGKAGLYKAGDAEAHPPELYWEHLNRAVPIIDYVASEAKKGWKISKAGQELARLPIYLLKYLMLAGDIGAGKQISREEISQLRSEFVSALNTINNGTSLFRQMIENDKRWTPDELRRIGKLAEHTQDELDPLVKTTNPNNEKQYE